jgi:hypothetical protein|tara:strand:- start:1967 stop:2275 length:309 start_codon:yes stop_codon:yes gene_type:complete
LTRKIVKNSAEMVAVMCGAGVDPAEATHLIGTSKHGMAFEMAKGDTQILLIVDPDDHTKDITFVPYASEELRMSGKLKSKYNHQWAKAREQERKASMRKKYG